MWYLIKRYIIRKEHIHKGLILPNERQFSNKKKKKRKFLLTSLIRVMSFQSAYSSNTSLINDQRSYELNDNIQRSSSTNPDQDKQNFISNLDQFSQGFKKLCEYAEYIDTERDTRDFRNRLFVQNYALLSFYQLTDIISVMNTFPECIHYQIDFKILYKQLNLDLLSQLLKREEYNFL